MGSMNSDGSIQVMESLVYIALEILFTIRIYLRFTVFNITNRKEGSLGKKYKKQFFEDVINLIHILFT